MTGNWSVGEVAVFSILITSAGEGVSGQTPVCRIRRKSDTQYWSGSVWDNPSTNLATTQLSVDYFKGTYIYILSADALTADDILYVCFDNTAGTPKIITTEVHRFTKDETTRTQVTQDWGDVADVTDYGGGDVVDGTGASQSAVRVRAIDVSNKIADETYTDANGQWKLFLVAAVNSQIPNIYTIEFYKANFTKADAQVKVPTTH